MAFLYKISVLRTLTQTEQKHFNSLGLAGSLSKSSKYGCYNSLQLYQEECIYMGEQLEWYISLQEIGWPAYENKKKTSYPLAKLSY